jgi:hypothetical protein
MYEIIRIGVSYTSGAIVKQSEQDIKYSNEYQCGGSIPLSDPPFWME